MSSTADVGSASSVPRARLHPFNPGQVYNFSKAQQVHVLPASNTQQGDLSLNWTNRSQVDVILNIDITPVLTWCPWLLVVQFSVLSQINTDTLAWGWLVSEAHYVQTVTNYVPMLG